MQTKAWRVQFFRAFQQAFFYVLSPKPGQATDASAMRPYLKTSKTGQNSAKQRKNAKKWAKKRKKRCFLAVFGQKMAFLGDEAPSTKHEARSPSPASAGRCLSPSTLHRIVLPFDIHARIYRGHEDSGAGVVGE
ncbi:MAG: hypothetical protein GX803_04310 [Lentisphaerae bacterium]|nr:hypothetical protein [Lentisphaerota bacterium]